MYHEQIYSKRITNEIKEKENNKRSSIGTQEREKKT